MQRMYLLFIIIYIYNPLFFICIRFFILKVCFILSHQCCSIIILGIQVCAILHQSPDVSQHCGLFSPTAFIYLLLRYPCTHKHRDRRNEDTLFPSWIFFFFTEVNCWLCLI